MAVTEAASAVAGIDLRLVTHDPSRSGPAAMLEVLAGSAADLDLVQQKLEAAKAATDAVPVSVLPSSQIAAFSKLKATVAAGIAMAEWTRRHYGPAVDVSLAAAPRVW